MMNILTFWHDQWTASLVNHLWQSTVFAAFAFALTLALKRNQARVRYWVWMAASAKFLLPFSLLMDAGSWMRSMIAAPIARPDVTSTIEQVTQPFPAAKHLELAGAPTSVHHLAWLPTLLVALWLCGMVMIAVRWMLAWMRIRATVRAAVPVEIEADVPVLISLALLEPGVFGMFRPVLVLPEGILCRLEPEQLGAILEHEMCHVRRKDNLTFALHMMTQALFWFHPLTWWIGARLTEERERACDEAVLEAGGEAEVYAEGILNVCKFYVETPLPCAAGVSGADLKNRIARIMSAPMTYRLNAGRRVLLIAAGLATVVLPVSLGLVHLALAEERIEDAVAKLPKFDVVSIRPNKVVNRILINLQADGISIEDMPLHSIIYQAFGLPEGRVLNEPDWTRSACFDIKAKVDPADGPKMKELKFDEKWEMLLPVLVDRFNLHYHHENRVMRVYTLVPTKGGTKLQHSTFQDPTPSGETNPVPGTGIRRPMMRITMNPAGFTIVGQDSTIEGLIREISHQTGNTVVDQTGLTGKYDYTLSWMPEHPMMKASDTGQQPGGGDSAISETGPSLLTALQEQLGLKLVPQKEPVDVIVIDHIQQPSPN